MSKQKSRAINILFPLSLLAAIGYLALLYGVYAHEATIVQNSPDADIFSVLSLFAVFLALITSPFLISFIWLATGIFRLIRSAVRKERDQVALTLLICGVLSLVASLVFVVTALQGRVHIH